MSLPLASFSRLLTSGLTLLLRSKPVPELQRGKDFSDPEAVRKQQHIDRIAMADEPKRKKKQ